jgi:hypothetical protein
MSYEAIAAALNHSQASTSSRLVLIAIAHYEGDNGSYPSQQTIARLTGLNVRSVRRAIKELTNLNELDVIADSGVGSGARKTNRYYVIVECPDGCDRSLNHKIVTAEIVSLSAIRRSQYRTNKVPIEDTRGSNRGHLAHQ